MVVRAGPQNEKWSDRQITENPTRSIHKEARKKSLTQKKLILIRGIAFEKITPFWGFGGYQKWHFGCPNQNSETIFQYKLAPETPKKPPQEPKSALKK